MLAWYLGSWYDPKVLQAYNSATPPPGPMASTVLSSGRPIRRLSLNVAQGARHGLQQLHPAGQAAAGPERFHGSRVMSSAPTVYDAVIVGAGASGSIIAKQLGLAGKKVLVLEAGAGVPPNINAFMQRSTLRSPRRPSRRIRPINAAGQRRSDRSVDPGRRPSDRADPARGQLAGPAPGLSDPAGPEKAFASTYERVALAARCGIGWHEPAFPAERLRDADEVPAGSRLAAELCGPRSLVRRSRVRDRRVGECGRQAALGITFPPGARPSMQAIRPAWSTTMSTRHPA